MGKQFSRKGLYELVWSKPMREAASDIGISDVGLAKACRAAGIPIPIQGHWNKIRASKPVEVLELPPRPPGVSDEVIVGGGRYGSYGYDKPDGEENLSAPVFEEELSSVLERIREQVGQVRMPKTLSSPHRLVERLLQADEDKRQQQLKDRHAFSWNRPIFDDPFEARRLKLLNAIFVALDHEGYRLSMRGKEARDLDVQIGGQGVSFDLDAASLKKTPDWRYQYHQPIKFDAEEKLKFQIWYPDETPGMKWSWVDAEQKLEAQLTDIVVHLIVAGEVHYRRHANERYKWRVHRLAELREERRKAKEEAEKQERLRIEREEQARVQQLFQEAKNLKRAREVRDYVAAVQAAIQTNGALTENVAKWSHWAMQLADQIDPLQAARLTERFASPDA